MIKWDEAKKLLQTTVTYNDQKTSNEDFVDHVAADIKKRNVTHIRLDGVAVHPDGKSFGGRQIIKTSDKGAPKADPWALVLVFIDDTNKISRLYKIDDRLISQGPPATSLSEITYKPSANPLSSDDLRNLYLEYINSYNIGTMSTVLPQKLAAEMAMQGNVAKVEQVVIILGQILLPAVAGLKYKVEDMVTDVEKQQIFVRLSLEGVPENKNLQKGADEKGRVKVYELATYGVEEGKIAWAWSAPDFDILPPQ
nr:SnoaL-like polyketide cyclase [Colletotrichum truncatum]KAF6780765.1 SnoaL-like polyketide cyclase [Colletotrichum truncatum]